MAVTRSLALIALVVLAGAIAAYGTRQEPRSGYDLCVKGVRRTDGGVLRVCDQLNADTVAAVRAALRPDDVELLLTSGGGGELDAMALGDLVAERGLTVRIRQFCASACATYVLPAAPAVIVEPYTVVAYHHTAAFVLDVLNDRANVPADYPTRAAAEAERAFFARHDHPTDLPWRIAMATQPDCVGVSDGGPTGTMTRVEYLVAWYVPNAAAFKEIVGAPVYGWWPTSATDTATILRLTLGQPEAAVAFGGLPAAPADTAAFARALPTCPSAQ